ncbi:MAG: 2-hydroxyacyl-CoA dehydratase [Verrucomicrobia bacterium]|jgi:benzoyl-CoA reductase/2-hydroxyglutaryl-CoA dehydratase subunit BcrC/BadD/HgdB|nr:2-hydroxyacyl-CoA dehydratase [Verrucomicrobiota bacterium]
MNTCCSADHAANAAAAAHPADAFHDMVQRCYDYATEQKALGRKLVGIMCEYTPREIIMAANAMPVCLCGGSVDMIPAAEQTLPSNLCPLIKSTFGYGVKKANPFLEMADLLVAETTCDGKKKMYELLRETYPMHVLELPQKPDNATALEHWITELRQLKQELETRFDVTITDDDLRNGIQLMNRERALRRELAGVMKQDAPPMTGRQLLEMKSLISGLPHDFSLYEEAIDVFKRQPPEQENTSGVRVLLTGVPLPHGAERVMDIIEDSGGLVVCQENCTGLKPLLEDVDPNTADPLRAIAETYFHLPCSVMTPNTRRMELLKQLNGEYRPQCVIELIWQACLTYDVESAKVKAMVEQELGIPYLRIETDYSPSDSARIAVRVQALFETVAARG